MLYRPTTKGHNAALELARKLAEDYNGNEDDLAELMLLCFKPLWQTFARDVIHETGSWSAYILGGTAIAGLPMLVPTNALLFWAWVHDAHYDCWVTIACVIGIQWSPIVSKRGKAGA